MIPCAAHGTLEVVHDEDGSIRYSTCYLCEALKTPESLILDNSRCERISQDAILVLESLENATSFKESRKPRVLAMITLKRFATHFRSSRLLDLDQTLGKWCLSSLTSSLRELRICAGYVGTSTNYAAG
jgi:serine/threonine-protein kinase ATR